MDIVTYALCKKLISKTLEGAGALKGERGLSAYEIAVESGYQGTQAEWLEGLKGEPGKTPYIGDNGNWFLDGTDTGICASGLKITSSKDSGGLIINEEDKTISSLVDGTPIVIANYKEDMAAIEKEVIQDLF